MSRNRVISRLFAGLVPLVIFGAVLLRSVSAAPSNPSIQVKLDTSKAAPRQVEDQTKQAIVRDYGAAWMNLEKALASNRADFLDANFAGAALRRWSSTLAEQAKIGTSQKFVDRGHQMTVAFYSVEGSAMELHDTAQFEIQYLDGTKVVHSERVTAHYVVLMTPAENSWKVRVLQEVPSGSPEQSAQLRFSGVGTASK